MHNDMIKLNCYGTEDIYPPLNQICDKDAVVFGGSDFGG
jgi:hypothetical protein